MNVFLFESRSQYTKVVRLCRLLQRLQNDPWRLALDNSVCMSRRIHPTILLIKKRMASPHQLVKCLVSIQREQLLEKCICFFFCTKIERSVWPETWYANIACVPVSALYKNMSRGRNSYRRSQLGWTATNNHPHIAGDCWLITLSVLLLFLLSAKSSW